MQAVSALSLAIFEAVSEEAVVLNTKRRMHNSSDNGKLRPSCNLRTATCEL